MIHAAPPIRRIDHLWIPLPDGLRLSARLWLPEDALQRPVPAILEAVPYRKGDLTAPADARWHAHLARGGYACLRLDIRGSGDSEGLLHDEYLAQEQEDNLAVIRWLAAQPWCSGKVGMIGYSWGGFAALQTAARRPEALGAIVTHCSADDRYLGDCHWMGGCLLASDMLKWASWMLVFGALPPDPAVYGPGWREAWLERLDGVAPLAETWLAHPLWDDYWQQGSVCVQPEAIQCAVLASGGWADPYVDTVFNLLGSLSAPVHGIIGPWSHTWPDAGRPGPAVGYWDQVILWFDRWLKGQANAVDAWPPLRAYLQEHRRPDPAEVSVPGSWLALAGPGNPVELAGLAVAPAEQAPGGPSRVPADPLRVPAEPLRVPADPLRVPADPLRVPAEPETGVRAGVWCPIGRAGELPDDQRSDDALSLCLDSPPAAVDEALLGIPRLQLRLRSGRSRGQIAARLCDVAPDGSSLLVSWGLYNLCHEDGHTRIVERIPGNWFTVEFPLRAAGHRLPAGHHWRLALSASYWPHAWPAHEPPLLDLDPLALHLRLPRLSAAQLAEAWPGCGFGPPSTEPGLELQRLRPPSWQRDIRGGQSGGQSGGLSIREATDAGAWATDAGVSADERALDRYRLRTHTAADAEVFAWRQVTLGRPGWKVRVKVSSRLRADADRFYLSSRVRAFEDATLVFDRNRRQNIPRHGI
jgi:predicted acyl esterase